jgi:D-arginine dehydrogenase
MRSDFLVIGGGIAGASVGSLLSPYGRVIVLEREAHPGYHATGRSAALFVESYGPAQVRALTAASRAFFENPPSEFGDHPLLTARGVLSVAREDQCHMLRSHLAQLRASGSDAHAISTAEACKLVPVLRAECAVEALLDANAADMDVAAILQGYLRIMRRAGGTLICEANVTDIQRRDGLWHVFAGSQRYEALILVNAAGAWADCVAKLAGARPIGIEPRRRAAFTFRAPDGADVRKWPMVVGAAEDWYFKPEAGFLLGSPANAELVEPHDVRPEELDIAEGIARIEEATTLRIVRPEHTWAGLRSFTADGELVIGFDDEVTGFFWLAGQGGYGIQTCAAAAQLASTLVRNVAVAPELISCGVDLSALGVDRLRTRARASIGQQ